MEQLHCNCSALRSAARTLTAAYDEALRDSGLRMTQFSILARLAAVGRVRLTELSRRLAMDRTTLARNLRPLEQEGWVTLSVGEDRRERFIELSAKGQRAVAKALPLWKAVHGRFERQFGKERAQALRELLGIVVEAGREMYEEMAGRPPH